jgi:hypothetical protein
MIMSAYSQIHRVTHLRFDDARVVMGYFVMVIMNIVQSLGWDLGHDEDLQNGL